MLAEEVKSSYWSWPPGTGKVKQQKMKKDTGAQDKSEVMYPWKQLYNVLYFQYLHSIIHLQSSTESFKVILMTPPP
jgi:hypothetical protein